MTRTRKQQTVAERVAGESRYARAAAEWVARYVGRDPSRIYGVTFGHEDEFRYSTLTFGESASAALRYFDNGREKSLRLEEVWIGQDPNAHPITPGEFIEQCIELLPPEGPTTADFARVSFGGRR